MLEFDKENSMKDTEESNEIRSRFKKLLYNTTGRKTNKAVPEKFKVVTSKLKLTRNPNAWICGISNWFVLVFRIQRTIPAVK